MNWNLEKKARLPKGFCLTDTVCSARNHKGSQLQEGVGPGKHHLMIKEPAEAQTQHLYSDGS